MAAFPDNLWRHVAYLVQSSAAEYLSQCPDLCSRLHGPAQAGGPAQSSNHDVKNL